jgi:hypothetical protein
MARAPPGPTSFASVVRKCTTSKRTVLIDLDITRVRDNYKAGNGIDFWRELVIRHAQPKFKECAQVLRCNALSIVGLSHDESPQKLFLLSNKGYFCFTQVLR